MIVHHLTNFLWRYPPKFPDRKRFAQHGRAQRIFVQVFDELVWFFRIVVLHVHVVCLRITLHRLQNSASNALFEKQIHVRIRKKFYFHLRYLQHAIPGKGCGRDVVYRIQFVLFEANADEVFEYVCEMEGVDLAVSFRVVRRFLHSNAFHSSFACA